MNGHGKYDRDNPMIFHLNNIHFRYIHIYSTVGIDWDSYNKMQQSQFRQLFSFSYDNISSVSNNKLRSTKLVSDVSF